jgi:hypothetical protein
MSYSFIQTPASMSLAQSPVIFAVSSSEHVFETNFQYIGELTIWTGSINQSASGEFWTLAKYPSTQGYTGIFDCSRIINSTQTQLTQQNQSPVSYFKLDSYYRYWNGTSYTTGSRITSDVFKAVDGYQIFPETIGESVQTMTPFWPIMTDGPASQSVFIDNVGTMGSYVGYLGSTPGLQANNMFYLGDNNSQGIYNLQTGSVADNSNEQISSFPIGPAELDFPLNLAGLTRFSIQARYNNVNIGAPINYVIGCQQKYPNIRIKWKNRYGQFDYLNFDMVNRKSMTSTKRTYQPQIGTFTGRTLSYNEYDSQALNYIVDSNQTIICNTNWLEESYNDILKQLLVSNEIYWCLDNSQEVKPLTIITSNIQFKTGVVDKLIQYSFEFQYGQGYKLII